MLSGDSAVKRNGFTADSGKLSFVSMSASTSGDLATIRDRVRYAMELEGRETGDTISQGKLERELKLRHAIKGESRGYMSSLLSGRRPKPSIEVLEALAGVLHVQLEWLAFGRGPIRRDGRLELTPFEQAMVFARQANCREDAIQNAWSHHAERRDTMNVYSWTIVIHAEAMSLDAAGVPRPEKVFDHHAAIQREKAKLDTTRKVRAEKERRDEEAGVVGRGKRASGGL